MILLDTNVFVYAVGSEHPLQQPCKDVIAAIGDGKLSATTTLPVVQEFAHVRARRLGRADAANQARSVITLVGSLTSSGVDDLHLALSLFEEYQQLDAFDAVLAATAIHSPHIEGLMSADRAFDGLSGLTRIDPTMDIASQRERPATNRPGSAQSTRP